jgi:hypothetical protein
MNNNLQIDLIDELSDNNFFVRKGDIELGRIVII